jgi:hypothetical protein
MKARLLVPCLILALLFGMAVGPTSASISPTFSLVVTFYGASSSSCGTGGHIGFSTSVTFGGGITHTQVATVTDGNGTVLFSQSGPDFSDGTYTAYGSFTFGATPTKNPISATIVFDGVTFTGSADDPCLPPSGFQGPPIPSGFVLKTITCNVAVYDAPGGKPVGSNAITSGQTWYVNPTPKMDAAGKSWTEVFVAGYTNGYVPTSCIR